MLDRSSSASSSKQLDHSTQPASQNVSDCPIFHDASDEPDTPSLTPAHFAAIDLLLTGATDTAVAQTLSISRRTLYRWKTHSPDFRLELARRREDLFRRQADRLTHLLSRSLDTLEKHLQDPYNPTSHRAAATLLRLSRLSHLLHPKPPRQASQLTTDNGQLTRPRRNPRPQNPLPTSCNPSPGAGHRQ